MSKLWYSHFNWNASAVLSLPSSLVCFNNVFHYYKSCKGYLYAVSTVFLFVYLTFWPVYLYRNISMEIFVPKLRLDFWLSNRMSPSICLKDSDWIKCFSGESENETWLNLSLHLKGNLMTVVAEYFSCIYLFNSILPVLIIIIVFTQLRACSV